MAARGKVRAARGGGTQGLTFDALRELALSFPGMEEGTSFGTPAFRVRKKFIARFHEDAWRRSASQRQLAERARAAD
ncbi:MmcQ/YjbR family DNA-binding protein [Corallococcus macrosporus]|uniref:Uncharacterized protein n=1 Tax=Corallococcus macrosporus DSM 14697 TaxID=1189310 RepID=A0A250JU55_9BACT|nr:MmcQ/YjbR family DNA-binding protein [Corallococcus macrosporus]ATB47429.1 hypothetical protein MYMAC_003043 [Corallococcus macrosporus DSM 14697]